MTPKRSKEPFGANEVRHCFVESVAQVSCQLPLCDNWMESPIVYDLPFAPAVEPETARFIPAAQARRMNKLMRRSLITSLQALRDAGVEHPDGIITGTGAGCMDNSEKFLEDICTYGDTGLKPTLFMQSTHNTLSSNIGIFLKCHGYNSTYSHKGISFESALLDSFIQLRAGTLENVLVGAHDETSPVMARILPATHPEYVFASDTSVSAVLSSHKSERSICEITEVRLFENHNSEVLVQKLSQNPGSVIIAGLNGNPVNDRPYFNLFEKLNYCAQNPKAVPQPSIHNPADDNPSDSINSSASHDTTNKPLILKYKHLFGENFSSLAIAFYIGVSILRYRSVPDALIHCNGEGRTDGKSSIKNISIVNHCDGEEWSLIQLELCPNILTTFHR